MTTLPRDEGPAVDVPVEQEDLENLPAGGPSPGRPDPADVLPEEDDDNPYQESDEALPDDEEEDAIARIPGKEEGRFDDV